MRFNIGSQQGALKQKRRSEKIGEAGNKNANHSGLAFGDMFLVARGGIEPPTQGFSILCSTN
jgi:hypothetical protein